MRHAHLKRSLRLLAIDSIKIFQVVEREYKEAAPCFDLSASRILNLETGMPGAVGTRWLVRCTTNALGTVYVMVHGMVHETASVSDSRLH